MARNDLYKSYLERLNIENILDFGPVFVEIGTGRPLQPNDPYGNLFTNTMSWICVLAVEQNSKLLRAGTVGNWRQEALEIQRRLELESAVLAGREDMLAALDQNELLVPPDVDAGWSELQEASKEIWVGAARKCGEFLLRLNIAISRKGKKGRPVGSATYAPVLDEQDHDLLKQVFKEEPAATHDRALLEKTLLKVLPQVIRLGLMRDLHSSAHESRHVSITTHMKRLRRLLDRMEEGT